MSMWRKQTVSSTCPHTHEHMHTRTHTHITPLTQRSHAKHNTPHHNTPTPPLPLLLHTNTLTHANIINSLFPFSMTTTNDLSLSQLSAHRARICPVGHMAWALAPSLFGEKKVETQICHCILAYISCRVK